MTGLIDNYLTQIQSHLCDDNEDILLELRSDIESEIEALESGQEYPVTNEQIAAVLKRYGHPLTVASQYRQQQYLIGPGLYLPYTQVLKYSLYIVIAIQALMVVVQRMISDAHALSVAGLFSGIIETGFIVAASVTLIFAALEYYGEKVSWFTEWDPVKSLGSRTVSGSRQDAVSNVITDSVVFLWWNDWFGFGGRLPFPGDFPVVATGIYDIIFMPVNALLVISLLFYSWQLLNNTWNKISLSIAVLTDVATLTILTYLLNNRTYFALTEQTPELVLMVERINFSAYLVLWVITGVVLYDLYQHAMRFRQLTRP